MWNNFTYILSPIVWIDQNVDIPTARLAAAVGATHHTARSRVQRLHCCQHHLLNVSDLQRCKEVGACSSQTGNRSVAYTVYICMCIDAWNVCEVCTLVSVCVGLRICLCDGHGCVSIHNLTKEVRAMDPLLSSPHLLSVHPFEQIFIAIESNHLLHSQGATGRESGCTRQQSWHRIIVISPLLLHLLRLHSLLLLNSSFRHRRYRRGREQGMHGGSQMCHWGVALLYQTPSSGGSHPPDLVELHAGLDVGVLALQSGGSRPDRRESDRHQQGRRWLGGIRSNTC